MNTATMKRPWHNGKSTHVFYDKPADYDGSVRLTHCQHADYRKQHGHRRAIQKYRQYEDADPKIRDLMDKLRKFEEYNMEKLKDFL